jgi:hypothetical protein
MLSPDKTSLWELRILILASCVSDTVLLGAFLDLVGLLDLLRLLFLHPLCRWPHLVGLPLRLLDLLRLSPLSLPLEGLLRNDHR